MTATLVSALFGALIGGFFVLCATHLEMSYKKRAEAERKKFEAREELRIRLFEYLQHTTDHGLEKIQPCLDSSIEEIRQRVRIISLMNVVEPSKEYRDAIETLLKERSDKAYYHAMGSETGNKKFMQLTRERLGMDHSQVWEYITDGIQKDPPVENSVNSEPYSSSKDEKSEPEVKS